MISNDLDYVAQYWNQTTFDLWEETDGMYVSEQVFPIYHRSLYESLKT